VGIAQSEGFCHDPIHRRAMVMDVLNGWIDRLAVWTVRSRRAHPWRWDGIDLVSGTGAASSLWFEFGDLVAIVFGAVMGFAMVLGWVGRFARWWQVRRSVSRQELH
jgi:hypothetical protein